MQGIIADKIIIFDNLVKFSFVFIIKYPKIYKEKILNNLAHSVTLSKGAGEKKEEISVINKNSDIGKIIGIFLKLNFLSVFIFLKFVIKIIREKKIAIMAVIEAKFSCISHIVIIDSLDKISKQGLIISNKNNPIKGLKNIVIITQYIKNKSKIIIGFKEIKDKISNVKAVAMSKS
ncbi:MAG: hypothetical protein V1649_02275 [Patescibacteria group bacterium]